MLVKVENHSALKWILDQYKEKKPKDPTIAEKFNIYNVADKEKAIDLLMRVCRDDCGNGWGGGGDGVLPIYK